MSTYDDLIALLEKHGADYTLIDHEPEGSTEAVSAMRGNPPGHAAKCLMLIVKPDRRTRRYVLAVVPGDRQLDLAAVKDRYGARYAGFCDTPTAERLARTVTGTVLPFAWDDEVDLLVDPDLMRAPRIWFNAARLDRSVSLATADYERVAAPDFHPIAAVR
jgi:Ala-tRNA(Pro) deacylase